MAISSSSLFQRRQARIRSIEALVSIIKDEPDAIALQEAADEIGKLPGAGVPGDVICVYAELLEGLSKGVQWGPAVRAAEVDADRYLVAARKIAADALASARSVPKNIIIAASMLAEMKDEGKIKECAKSLLAVPLPSRLTGVTIPKIVPTMPAPVRPSPSIQPRVLVLLSLDGNLIQSPLALKLNTRHEVLVRTTVKAWPDDAVRLNIDFIGTALPSEVSIHSCEMTQDLQEAPSSIILRVDLADPTTPLHFLTRAEFEFSDGSTVEAEVLGHSRFEITSFDPATALPRSMPAAAYNLLELIAELKVKKPILEKNAYDDFFSMFESLSRFANLRMQVAREGRVLEADFQKDLKLHFTADPNIGAQLQEKQHKGRGITDLVLGDVVLELKVENDEEVTPENAFKYINQAAHYAAFGEQQISILCILDNSPKSAQPAVLASYCGWMYPKSHGLTDPRYPSMVAVMIIPVGFPVPSDWSR